MSDVCLADSVRRKPIVRLRKDLGDVICGKEITEIFDLDNDRNVSVCFTVADDDDPEDGFAIVPKRHQTLPGKTARFKVTFTSHVPGIVHEKKYVVSDGEEIIADFSMRCTSLGPRITPEQVTLKFFILRNVKFQAKRFELENKSKCPTKFHLERPGRNLPFRITQESGEIRGGGKFILDVRFQPSQLGIYRKRVFCLFRFHPPVVITLIGVYNPGAKIDPRRINFYSIPEEVANDNYQSFMMTLNDSHVSDDIDPCLEMVSARKATVKFAEDESREDEDDSSDGDEEESEDDATRKEIHKAVLSLYYVNVGNNSLLTEGIQLINTSSSKEFYFEWSNENGKCFSVTPKSGNLKEGQAIDFNVKFSPDERDRLFHGELDVRIFPLNTGVNDSGDVVTLPTTLNLSVIGHSFPDDSAGWLEQCELEPDHLTLPSCIPGEVVYSTLMMKRFGHLPVVFQFIPPNRSRIKINPPIGYIARSYQLFVVEFNSPTGWEGTYSETWKISYNSAAKHHDRMRIISRVENPKITFGEDNVFAFETTLPGGVSKSSVLIANPTRLKIRYEFVIPKDVSWVEIPILEGELEPLGSGYIDVVFKPTETKEYMDYVYCWTRSAARQDYKVSNRIELRGSCQDGFLVATPAFHNFGKHLIDAEVKKTFKIFNFTPILMNFKLSTMSDAFPEDRVRNAVKVIPHRGSITGKTNIEVEVTLTPRTIDSCKITVVCDLLSSDTEDSRPCSKPRPIFTLQIEGVLPTCQIIDLNVEGGGPLMSPDWLWKMMDVEGMNKAIRTILPGEEAVMHVKLPDAAVGATAMTVYMLVEAGRDCGVSVRIRNTYWKHFARKLTLTLLQADGRNGMTIQPSDIHLEPRRREIVKIEFKYDAVGSTLYEWSLNLSLNRVLTIRCVLNGFPNDGATQVSTVLEPELELKPVFIGDLNPPIQLFWLYNNTPYQTSYVLDKTFLREATHPFPRIFNCLNANGILPPFSSHPLMLKFVPNELRRYQVRTHLCLKTDQLEELTITGSGVLNHSKFSEFSHDETVPEIPLMKQFKVTVVPSVKVITIKPFPTFSSVRRIFFLENVSDDKVWAFRWHSFNVETLVHAMVEPNEGRINPRERITAILTVESFSHPTSISFSVPCDVIDYTALQAYEKAVRMKEIIAEKCKDHFTITEKGITNEIPEVALPEEPTKCHVFVTVRTNVVADELIEAKLYPKDVQNLPYGLQVPEFGFDGTKLNEEIAHLVNGVVERVVWSLLNSPNFSRRLVDYSEEYGRATYSQILPGGEKERKNIRKRSIACLPKNLMQSVLEKTIIDILSKNFRH